MGEEGSSAMAIHSLKSGTPPKEKMPLSSVGFRVPISQSYLTDN